jgi:hypothetical protein
LRLPVQLRDLLRLQRNARRRRVLRARPERLVRQAHHRRVKDFQCVRANPALTRIGPALRKECALRLLPAKFVRAVRRDPAVPRRGIRSAPEAEDVLETNRLAANVPEPLAAFPRPSPENLCMRASPLPRAGGRRLRSAMRKVSADFIRCARAPVWERDAPRTLSRSLRCNANRAR